MNYNYLYKLFLISKLFSISVILIFSYGKFRSLYPQYQDPLMYKIGIYNLDGWSLTHFFWYGYIGYKYPIYYIEVMLGGIIWELFEHWMGEFRPAILGGFGDCPQNINAIKNEKWWYGRYSDILMNIIGFYIGKKLVF